MHTISLNITDNLSNKSLISKTVRVFDYNLILSFCSFFTDLLPPNMSVEHIISQLLYLCEK